MYKNNRKENLVLNKNVAIFSKKVNTNYILVPFKPSIHQLGKIKYLPAISKEWKNSVYNYNFNNNINYPLYNFNINSLIKGYFSLFINETFFGQKLNKSIRSRRKSLSRIFVSTPEVKHTNNKAIITLYVYNRERLILLNKIGYIKNLFLFNKINSIKEKLYKLISKTSTRVTEFYKYKFNSKNSLNFIFFLLKYKILNQFNFQQKKGITLNFVWLKILRTWFLSLEN